MLLSGIFLLTAILTTPTWALSRKRRQSTSSVNDPDDPRFSLSNLARVFYTLLEQSRGGTGISVSNPYITPPTCNFTSPVRTLDGTCNNVNNPRWGAAKTPLRRLTRNSYDDGINSPRSKHYRSAGSLPTPRVISTTLNDKSSNMSSKHSHLLVGYGQFLDHDITLSPEAGGEGGVFDFVDHCCDKEERDYVNEYRECFPIRMVADEVFTRTCIPFLRSSPVPPPTAGGQVIRHQMNDITSYVDASNIYGTTSIKASYLRSFVDGKLKVSFGKDGEERMPTSPDNPPSCAVQLEDLNCMFIGGDVRNSDAAGLSSIHSLLLREHNRIAEQLKLMNPQMTIKENQDEMLYQATRKIVGAMLQRITYGEWLPEVVGQPIMMRYNLMVKDSGRPTGYSANVDPSIMTEFSSAAFRFGHTLVRQTFSTTPGSEVDLDQIFHAFQTVDRVGASALLKGLTVDPMQNFDRFITPGLRDKLFGKQLDLITFNIQRGRDHGIGSYNDVRRYFGLTVHSSYDTMIGTTHNLATINQLKKLYPTPDDIELFPGGVSEFPASGAIVSETFANIIGLQFSMIKMGDRFWHENNDPVIKFSDDQLQEIRKASFAGLFCENVSGTRVRKHLLRMETFSNPAVSCDSIAKMDMSKWTGLGNSNQPDRGTQRPAFRRRPQFPNRQRNQKLRCRGRKRRCRVA